AMGICDAAEACDGAILVCPLDVSLPDNTSCDDVSFCNGMERCIAGACMPAASGADCADTDLCTSDTCSDPGGCAHSRIAGCCNNSTECGDSDVCTVDLCSGPGG